jgi:phage FluMu gp28-like protein
MKIKGFKPRPSQKEFLLSTARFKVISAGRRFGKTIAALNWLLEGALNHRGWNSMWVAPTYRQGRYAFKRLMSALRLSGGMSIISRVSESDMVIEFINHSSISFRTAENYDNLRAEGINRLVIDEAARIPKAAWEEVLRPAISDTGGDVMFISTPKGRNWFYHLWLMGKNPEYPEYQSWQFPSSDNPKIRPEDIELARKTLPENVFKQEFMAEFIEEGGEVVPNVDVCIVLPELIATKEPGRQYYGGIDLARKRDYTVITILDDELRLIDFIRFTGVNWDIQKEKIAEMVRKYDALTLVDQTGVGDPIVQELLLSDVYVRGFTFTAEKKRSLVQNLIFGFGEKKIQLAKIPVLIEELKALDYKQSESGNISYQAPEGMTDDCVMSLALAYWAATREAWPGVRSI